MLYRLVKHFNCDKLTMLLPANLTANVQSCENEIESVHLQEVLIWCEDVLVPCDHHCTDC